MIWLMSAYPKLNFCNRLIDSVSDSVIELLISVLTLSKVFNFRYPNLNDY